MIISVPLFVTIGKRKKKNFYLNLNTYRNAYFHQLNAAKILFKEIVTSRIKHLSVHQNIRLTYIVYPKTKRKFDVANVCSVVDKFFSDALVECGKLPDDNYENLPEVIYKFGHINKENPRVDIHIEPLQSKNIGNPIMETKTIESDNTEVLKSVNIDIKPRAKGHGFTAVVDIETEPYGSRQTATEAPTVAETVKPKATTTNKTKETPTPITKITEPVANISSGSEERVESEVEPVVEESEPVSNTTSIFAKPTAKQPFADESGETQEEEEEELVEEEPTPVEEAPKKKIMFNFQKT